NTLADGLRHFFRFAAAEPDHARRRISDHHQRRERQILAALHYLGDAVDGHYLVLQLVLIRVEFSLYYRHSFLDPLSPAAGLKLRSHNEDPQGLRTEGPLRAPLPPAPWSARGRGTRAA